MPYRIRKKRNKDCYVVRNTETNRIKAKCTTKKEAKAQVRLLESLEKK